MSSEKKWESYEEVATHLLNQYADHFGVGYFEGKQVVPGKSGTSWEIDAKGCSQNGKSIIVVECKRHTKQGINQAIAGALAFSIQDVGAEGGILVSPIGLQKGAKMVASASNVIEVKLDENSTTQDYVLSFLNQVCVGTSASLRVTDGYKITVKDEHGNIIDTREG